ncbi:hypothetical protein [Sphingobacterium sp. UBA6320]|uniref:hypothetical protein n=1 Tax=Sphingobacterium sp. UBA6320 TaxID=1947510 RepID=UPI002600557E|nr:hypothetical protein [Sphingobacterium sp. UBA6320]
MNQTRKYYVEYPNKIGKFKLNFGSVNQYGMQKACFRGEDSYNPIYLEPGYETVDGLFFSCPIRICFIEVRGIQLDLMTNNYLANCLVFSKDYALHKKLTIKVDESMGFMGVNQYINILNEYVDNVNDIFNLKNEIDHFCLKTSSDNHIIQIINKLEFQEFECSYAHVGKDNSFWSEHFIKNIPENRHLQDCIIKALSQCYGEKVVQKDARTLEVSFNHHKAWSQHIGRIDNGIIAGDNIRELLKLHFFRFYNKNKEMYCNFMQNTA